MTLEGEHLINFDANNDDLINENEVTRKKANNDVQKHYDQCLKIFFRIKIQSNEEENL